MFERLFGLRGISTGDVHRLIQEKGATIIDVNAPESWMRAHVPGAVNLDPAGYSDADLPPDKNAALVFYCSNPLCRKAPGAARRAAKMGYRNVRVMSAGINGWLSAGLPTEGGE